MKNETDVKIKATSNLADVIPVLEEAGYEVGLYPLDSKPDGVSYVYVPNRFWKEKDKLFVLLATGGTYGRGSTGSLVAFVITDAQSRWLFASFTTGGVDFGGNGVSLREWKRDAVNRYSPKAAEKARIAAERRDEEAEEKEREHFRRRGEAYRADLNEAVGNIKQTLFAAIGDQDATDRAFDALVQAELLALPQRWQYFRWTGMTYLSEEERNALFDNEEGDDD